MPQKFTTYVVSVLVLLSLIFSWLAWTNAASRGSVLGDTMAQLEQTHQINACTVIDPPAVIKDANSGALSGHMVEALENIAKRIDAKVRWTETTWGNAAADLQSHRCDVVATDLFANVPRAAAVAFTRPPILYIGESALVNKNGKFTNVKDIFDFDKPEITVAVATGESGDIFVKENFHNAKVVRIDVEAADLTRFAAEVSAGRADVAVADANTIRLYAEKHPEALDLFKGRPFALNPVGWAVRQDDTRWLNFLETSLQFLDTQGVLTQLEKKYNAHWLHDVRATEIR